MTELPSWKRSSLRTKLLVFSALLVIVPGMLLSLFAERSGRRSLRDVIGRELARESSHLAERVTTHFRTEQTTIDRFALQDVMREIAVSDVDKRITSSLAALRAGAPERLAYVVVDRTDRIVASTDPEYLREPPGWALRAPSVPAELVDLGTGRVGLVLSAPVPDPDAPTGNIGRLVALLDWERASDLIEGANEALAAAAIEARIAVTDPGGSIRRITPGAEHTDRRAAELASRRLVSERKGRTDLLPADDGDWIVGHAALGDPLLGWTLWILEPAERAFAPATRLRDRIALMTFAALVVGLSVAAIGARRVVHPLTELAAAIRGLARGEKREQPVPVRSEDEVGELAVSFNAMIRELDETQAHLVEAEKFAFVGELAAGVAHQVRTSLGVLRNSAKILGRSMPKDTDPAAHEMLSMIAAEVDRLSGVVNDLLTLGAGRRLDLRKLDLGVPLRAAVAFVEPRARQEGVVVEASLPDRGPFVAGDADALEQVCVNLLSNAMSAVGKGGHVRVEVLPPVRGRAAFSVRDDGPGVPDGLRERIFEPFVTDRAGGVGLGLTLVKKMVHAHRGSVRVDEEERDGACFVVELPLWKEEP